MKMTTTLSTKGRVTRGYGRLTSGAAPAPPAGSRQPPDSAASTIRAQASASEPASWCWRGMSRRRQTSGSLALAMGHRRCASFTVFDARGDVVGFDIDHAAERLELATLETEALPVRAYKAG